MTHSFFHSNCVSNCIQIAFTKWCHFYWNAIQPKTYWNTYCLWESTGFICSSSDYTNVCSVIIRGCGVIAKTTFSPHSRRNRWYEAVKHLMLSGDLLTINKFVKIPLFSSEKAYREICQLKSWMQSPSLHCYHCGFWFGYEYLSLTLSIEIDCCLI